MASSDSTASPGDSLAQSPLAPWTGLIGHDELRGRWAKMVAAQMLPQVLLLHGREGIGKRSLLAALAALPYCASADACGSCSPCKQIMIGQHSEVLWLETSGARLNLETADSLQEHLSLSPGLGASRRTVVLVDADKLSVQAANRLLKVLEEPPPKAQVILSTSRLGAILPTILSRCVKWSVPPPPGAQTAAWLAQQLVAAKREPLLPERMDELLRQAGLAPGAALQLLGLGQDAAAAGSDVPLGVFAPQTRSQAMAAADSWLGQSPHGAAGLLKDFELALNGRYRAVLGGYEWAIAPTHTKQLRQRLRRAKALACGAGIALNAQLAAEALALTSVAGETQGDLWMG